MRAYRQSIYGTLLACSSSLAEAQLHRFVDPFIGTEGTVSGTGYNGGNTFPGAVLPFGMVKLGPDLTSDNSSINANAGYLPDGKVTGFSLTHVSGTGGGPIYGVVAQMPLATLDGVNLVDNLTYAQPRVGHDHAEVGYYRSDFENGIETELTAAERVGFLQYTFPEEAERHILVDVSHYLPLPGGYSQGQAYSNGEIEVSADGIQYTGSGTFRGGFSHSPNYRVFFSGRFSEPAQTQLFSGPYTDYFYPSDLNAQATMSNVSYMSGGPPYYNFGKRVGALFAFPGGNSVLQSKVGISFTSAANACANIDQQLPHWDFNATVSAAPLIWDETLGTIKIADQSNFTRMQMFYTALYHTHLMPTDRTGDNANWVTSEPSYDDFYTLWDTFRCTNPLWNLIQPARSVAMLRSLIDIWRHEQFMPDGRSGNANGQVQGGSNSDNVLADAFVKGIGTDPSSGINWTEALLAMKTNAELTPWNNFDTGDPTGSTMQGRSTLSDWLKYGYLTPESDRSVSRTVEYSLNDFALSQVALGLNLTADHEKYLNRSAGWQLLWDPELTSLNHSGFIAPRYANGSRDPEYNPADCGGGCENGGYTYEALGWEYTWAAPHDMQSLIALSGGEAATEERLDIMFTPGLKNAGGVGEGQLNSAGEDTLFNPGNEPSFLTPFLYNYLPGRQWKSVMRSREIVNEYYKVGPSGLPGNSDGGALDSWLIWNMLGLYPVSTVPVYLVLAPMVGNYTMKVGEGEEEVLVVDVEVQGGGEAESKEAMYVQSLKVNGAEWNRSWIGHEDIKGGGRLEFVLGTEPVEWDVGEVPPSPGHAELDL